MAAAQRDLVDLDAVDLAQVGEDQQVVVGGGHENLLDVVVFLEAHAALALAAALLSFLPTKAFLLLLFEFIPSISKPYKELKVSFKNCFSLKNA